MRETGLPCTVQQPDVGRTTDRAIRDDAAVVGRETGIDGTDPGKAGGFGFDGRSGVVRDETAKAIVDLLGFEAAAAATTGPALSAPLPERTQDDDPGR